MIERAECVCPPLELQVIPDRKLLEAGEIQVCVLRPGQIVAAFIAERVGCGISVAGGVEVFGKGLRPVVSVTALRGPHLDAAARVGGVCRVDVEWEATLHS